MLKIRLSVIGRDGEKRPIDGAQIKKAYRRVEETVKAGAETVKKEVAAVRDRDPAANDEMSDLEILTLYSGVHAILGHRAAHALLERGHGFAARTLSQGMRLLTGVEIHPGAQIGQGVFIDHGTGVVIGETAVVGDGCTIYQGATLGGTGKETGKRHPTIGENVMVGAGSKILGPVNVGDNSKIAAGAVVLTDIPANCTAVGIPARIVKQDNVRVEPDLDQIHIPDPVGKEFENIRKELAALKKEMREKANAQEEGAGDTIEEGD